LGTLLFIVLIVVLVAALVGAGGYSVRRYWSPAGSEIVETDTTTSGVGAGLAAAMLALLLLILLFFGFTQWNWFGTRSVTPLSNSTTVTSPAPGGGAVTSPVVSPKPSAS